MTDTTFKVTLEAYSFETVAAADTYRTALIEVFTSMPESKDVAASTDVVKVYQSSHRQVPERLDHFEEFIRADIHAAVVAERDQLEEAVNELLIVWQNDGSVGDLDLVKLHATIKSIETNRTELEKHHA